MNYRSILDLNNTIVHGLTRVPKNIEVIAGVPRSGLLAANMLALHLNLPLTDVEGLRSGRLLSGGRRDQTVTLDQPRKVLVLDDSINSGRQMELVRDALADVPHELVFGAIYALNKEANGVDLYFEHVPQPRIFEWNIMHHPVLQTSCVDVDGVLCVDPTKEQNDDGPIYKEFVQNAPALFIPTVPVGWLVTCRLEKYRSLTEEWLARNGVEYGELIMMDYATKEERIAAGSHGKYKARVYKKTDANLFIESSLQQAVEIAKASGRPVFCVDRREMVYPSFAQARHQTKKGVRWIKRRLKQGLQAIGLIR